MGGKRKVSQDVPQSKTARASMGKKGAKDDGFKASGDMARIISCGGGTHAYLLDPRDGKTHHEAVDSEKWARLLGELLVSEHGPRIMAELEALGWGETLVLVGEAK